MMTQLELDLGLPFLALRREVEPTQRLRWTYNPRQLRLFR